MAIQIVRLFLAFDCLLLIHGANLPTVTVSIGAPHTIRFPNSNVTTSKVTTPKETTSLLEVSPTLSTTTETSSIKPSKAFGNVKIIGNYSVAVQHVTQDEELVVKATPLLELLNILRQLPKEKLLELYPKLLDETKNGPQRTSTESALEILNDIRENPPTTTTTTTSTTRQTTKYTTLATTETPATKGSTVAEEVTTIATTNMTFNSTTVSTTRSMDKVGNLTEFTTETLSEYDGSSTERNPSSVTPNDEFISTTEYLSTVPITYEFTDYPPPLPPSLPQFPSVVVTHHDDKHERIDRIDASFAIGVAVGIFACVIVASTAVTWCVCRKHWGRRNVYATMETEDIPKAFTKPGPPVILPREYEHTRRLSNTPASASEQQRGQEDCNRVTEL